MEKFVLDIKQGEGIGESVYAEKITEDTARIISIPFWGGVAPGDLVKFVNGEVVEVLERTGTVYYVSINEEVDKVSSYFDKFGIQVESLGQFDDSLRYGLAVPNGVDIEEILEEAPWTVKNPSTI